MITFSDDYIQRVIGAQKVGRLEWHPEVYDYAVVRADPALAPWIGIVMRVEPGCVHIAWPDRMAVTREKEEDLYWIPTAEDLRGAAESKGVAFYLPASGPEISLLSAYMAAVGPKGLEVQWIPGRGWVDMPPACPYCGGPARYAPPGERAPGPGKGA